MTEDNNTKKQEWITQQLGGLSLNKAEEERKVAWLHTLVDIGGHTNSITTKTVFPVGESIKIHSAVLPRLFREIMQEIQTYFQFIYSSDKYANVPHHVYLDCLSCIEWECYCDIITKYCPGMPILFHWGWITKTGVWMEF